MVTDFVLPYYSKQNIIIKILIIFSTIINAFIVDNNESLLIILIIDILLFLPGFKVIKSWSHIMLRLLPLFSSIIFLGIIFSIDFPNQIHLIIRIAILLIISSYIIHAFTFEFTLRQNDNKVLLFLATTMFYIKKLFIKFSDFNREQKKFSENIKTIIQDVARSDFHNQEIKKSTMDSSASTISIIHNLIILVIQLLGGYLFIWNVI